MRRLPPNPCCTECIRDNLNSTNTPKVKFQDKRGEEINKREQNIPKNSIGNRTTVKIRIKRHLYKGEERKKRGE